MTIRKLNTIVAVSVLSIGGLFAGVLLVPGLKELQRRRAEIHEKVEEVKNTQAQIGRVSDIYTEITAFDQRTGNYRTKLPADREFGEFLRSLSDELRRLGVEQNTVQPKTEEHLEPTLLPADLKLAGTTRLLPVQVSFDSNFSQVFEFLKSVEDLPRLSHVESIDITNDEHSPSHVHAEIMLITFYHPDEEARETNS